MGELKENEINDFDVIVIGAGIAGVSAAAVLSESARVLLLEAEEQEGYHATGRSAAYFCPGYGNAVVRDITVAGDTFFREPPGDIFDSPLLILRDWLFIARKDQAQALRDVADELAGNGKRIDTPEALELVPILKEDYLELALIITGGGDVDVHAMMQGYLRMLKRRGGQRLNECKVSRLERDAEGWIIGAGDREFRAPVVVNAAGAWADNVAELAGLEGLNIEPLRRSACLVDAPRGEDISAWPVVVDIAEEFYFKPEAGLIMVSPADETPVAPMDAHPDDLDIAIGVDRFERATVMDVRRVSHQWAGLRTFAPDRSPVVGFDSRAEGFFWLAGQGGYGVQTAPALAWLTAHLVLGTPMPGRAAGAIEHIPKLSPGRFL